MTLTTSISQLGKRFQVVYYKVRFWVLFVLPYSSGFQSCQFNIVKLVDDTKLFGRVNSDTNRDIIQQDLSRLGVVGQTVNDIQYFNLVYLILCQLGWLSHSRIPSFES